MLARMAPKLLIGLCGYSFPDWEGIVYPRGVPSGFSRLRYLADYVDLIEINRSFYRPLEPRSSDAWLVELGSTPLLFSGKLSERFTHGPADPDIDRIELTAALAGFEPFFRAGRWRGLVIQYPRYFEPLERNVDRLCRLVDATRPWNPVVEVRHRDWWAPELLDDFASRGIGLCPIDWPSATTHVPSEIPPKSAAPYVRLHGRNAEEWLSTEEDPNARGDRYDYLYAERELSEWVDRVRSPALLENIGAAVNEVVMVTNNCTAGKAVASALMLRALRDKAKVPVPDALLATYPVLKTVATPGRRSLFE
jgi:uncharacterized protein YecE (DUF72 family)